MSGCHVVIAVYPVTLRQPPDWPVGPLPVDIVDPRRPLVADRARRSMYYPPRTARLLYGTDAVPRRWHRVLQLVVDGVESMAAEVLLAQGNTGLLAIHLRATTGTPLDIVRSLARRWPDDLEISAQRCVPGLAIETIGAKPYTVAFTTERPMPQLYRHPRYLHWAHVDQWLWALASRTGPADHPPDLLRDTENKLRLSADWSALVLRDGVAFVGTRVDLGAADPFYGSAVGYVRSIYLDAVLIGQLQLHGIADLEEQLACTVIDTPTPASMSHLERAVTEFRHRLWWQHLSMHGVPNDLLTAHRQQHRLPERFEQILSEVQDFNQSVRDAHNLHAANAALLFSLATVPAGIAVATLQIVGRATIWTYLAIALVVTGITAALLTTRTGRRAIHAIRRPN
ncbi:hypothetical protein [Nocardia sp. NPDC049149]|uniref:hypothetical protein n=1 Tax=Nocardia sp. NPDC049149 TaxID=3364315 RepID=UPI0037170069